MMTREQYRKQLNDQLNKNGYNYNHNSRLATWWYWHKGRTGWIVIILILICAFFIWDGITSSQSFQQNSYDPHNPNTTADNRINNHQPISVLIKISKIGKKSPDFSRGDELPLILLRAILYGSFLLLIV